MSSIQSYNSTIRPVGPYNPTRPAANGSSWVPTVPSSPAPSVPSAPSYNGGFEPPVSFTLSPGAKSFFGKIGAGFSEQFKKNGSRLIHPIDTFKTMLDTSPRQAWNNFVAPYKADFASGQGAKAIGRLAANALFIGGAILGGRALMGRIGGGASIGVGGFGGDVLGGVGRVVGSVVRGVGSVVAAPFRFLGNMLRGGASIGYR